MKRGKIFTIFSRAYHGHTTALIDISPYKFRKLGAKGKKDYIHVAPTPDPYRGIFQGEATPELGGKYALEVKKLIDQAHKDGKKVITIQCVIFACICNLIPWGVLLENLGGGGCGILLETLAYFRPK